MKIIWNRESKKAVLVFVSLLLVSMFVVNYSVEMYIRQVRLEYNGVLAAIFGNIQETYPDVAQDELIRILNERGNEAVGAAILAGYGIYEGYDGVSFAAQERQLLLLRVGANLFSFLLLLICGVFFFRYLEKRQRRILDLTEYMDALNRGRYRLDIEENTDDELSGLRNEVYKTTVLLKEQAVNAEEQRRALADSVADISHQLKTPLTSITVLADNLMENTEMEERTRQHFLREIVHQIAGMSWLVTAMLKLSRFEAGVVELERSHISVKNLAREAVQKLELAAEWKEITFSINIQEDAELNVDRKWTVEALMNIVKNAIEHSPNGGCVEISGEENEVYTQIAVKNYGEGISEEEQKKLFRRFYNGSSVREDSMGIGLALAKEIVEKQNGFLSVDSGADKGTIFFFKFLKN